MAGAVLLMFACVLPGGCGDGGAATDSPALVLIDSVALEEGDSSYVAEPGDMALMPDGTFLIADRFVKKVHAFGRDGRFLRGFGRAGHGPGEFGTPGFLALDGDSLLYAGDVSEVEVFDLRTSAHLGSYRMPRWPGVLAVSSVRLFSGYADPVRLGSIARIARDTSRLHVTGPFPELLKDGGLFPMFNSVAIAMKGDTAVTAYNVTNDVYLSDVAGKVLDSIPVPVKRRHGVDPALLRRFARNTTDQELGEAAVYGSSLPMDLHWLPGGKIALVSTDWGLVGNRFVDSSYVSVVDPRTRQSCVDARIPGPVDPPVRVTFRGDTLFVLAQEVTGATRASTVIRFYRIDTSACKWTSK